MTVFWDVARGSPVETTDVLDVLNASETAVNCYLTTRLNILEEIQLNARHRENLKSEVIICDEEYKVWDFCSCSLHQLPVNSSFFNL
jgi:hypothetical protein